MYQNGGMHTWPQRKVLYRSDTGAPLSVMSDNFNTVQPSDILNLYSKIAEVAGFTLETAGSLIGGRKIWALARVSDGADVTGVDRVRPYVLLATSYDGSMATTVKEVVERVVCNNTIQIAMNERGGREIRVLHSMKWTDEIAERVRMDLGFVHNAYEQFIVSARALAGRPMSGVEADEFVAHLLEPYYGGMKSDGGVRDVRESKGYKRILELFNGAAIGRDMAGGANRWGMLNAVTQLIDHERGKSDSSRINSAWFGTGNAMKERAFAILEGEFSRIDA